MKYIHEVRLIMPLRILVFVQRINDDAEAVVGVLLAADYFLKCCLNYRVADRKTHALGLPL